MLDVTGAAQLRELLSDVEAAEVARRAAGPCDIVSIQARPFADGLTGFLGEHLRVTMRVRTPAGDRDLRLFIKAVPAHNPDKAKFIDEGNFYKREALIFKLCEELGGDDGPNPWHAKAYLYSDRILVMPDLSVEGFVPRPITQPLDLPHTLIVTASVARYHAAYADYAAKKSRNGHLFYNILEDHSDIMTDANFCDSQWMRTGAKLSANLIEAYSDKYRAAVPDLEEVVTKLFIETCDELKTYEGTLNVVLHRDLWSNNILFKHDASGAPAQAVLVDWQCVRVGPPAFDLAMLLYMTTTRAFRELNEAVVLRHYYETFDAALKESTRARLREVGYGFQELTSWYELARRYGIMLAMTIMPYALMESVCAARVFDDPDTYQSYLVEDRSPPVLQHCKDNPHYRSRQLEVSEEFLDRYLPISS